MSINQAAACSTDMRLRRIAERAQPRDQLVALDFDFV